MGKKTKAEKSKNKTKETMHIHKIEEKKAIAENRNKIREKRQERLMYRKEKEKAVLKWDKLDNTANLFPVIANESVSNVFRLAMVLNEDIDRDKLQKALDMVLPKFDIFNVRLKKGIFWYYFETNLREAPLVYEEEDYPCRFIEAYANNNYMFRLSYYKQRINLEVFHVLSDGLGVITFLREIVYQYLRLAHTELSDNLEDRLSSETSLNKEDSYIKNFKKAHPKNYKSEKAFILKGHMFPKEKFGIIHGYIDIIDLKRVCKEKGVSINQFLVGTLMWSIYKEYLNEAPSDIPIRACVPVNLRPYFNSITTKNFFAVVSATFKPEEEHYSFDEVLGIIATDLKEQITKENLEKMFSYNVASEKSLLLRAVPLFVKNIAMKNVYRTSARANTTTITNIGSMDIQEEYRQYIDKIYAVLSMSPGQNLKGSICSYQNTLVFTFSSALTDTSVQKTFFRKMTELGIKVSVESNGVYYE